MEPQKNTSGIAPAAEPKSMMTVMELAAYTGYKKSYIYKMVWERRIPHCKAPQGRKLFFEYDKIVAWLTAQQPKTVEEIVNSLNR
jgi:excisionase family DNA binding protein